MKLSQKSIFGELKCPKMDFLDILIDFWGHVSGGSKMAFFGLSNALLGGLCRGTGPISRLSLKNDLKRFSGWEFKVS